MLRQWLKTKINNMGTMYSLMKDKIQLMGGGRGGERKATGENMESRNGKQDLHLNYIVQYKQWKYSERCCPEQCV